MASYGDSFIYFLYFISCILEGRNLACQLIGCFLTWLTVRWQRWRQYVSPKRRVLSKLPSVRDQKGAVVTVTAMGTSNPAQAEKTCYWVWSAPNSLSLSLSLIHTHTHKHIYTYTKNTVAWVRERTIPTERPPLVGEVSANFLCG
jgi:hypothetical protein